jgi:photosystem II stability/assembly factor-like uncharacterized protein
MAGGRLAVRSLVALAIVLVAALTLACSPHASREPWHAVQVPTDAEFTGMWFTDSLNGWLTGGGPMVEGGMVGRTRDGGRTWRFQSGFIPSFGSSFAFHGVQFRDTLRGCVVSDGGIVQLTDDGGETWREVHRGRGSGDALMDLQLLDDGRGWAAGPASIVGTSDGGETWGGLVYNSSANGYLSSHAIHFVDARHGWLASHGGLLLRSDDAGVSWSPVPLPLRSGERPNLWDVSFCDAEHGWVAGERGSIFHTGDGGMTWELQEQGVPVVRVPRKGEPRRPREPVPELETPPDPLSVSAVRFVDPRHGWAIGYYADVAESVVLRSDDGGAHWRVERVVPGELLRTLFALDERHAWAAGDRARTAPQVVLRYGPGAD